MRKTALSLIFLFLGAFSAFGQGYELTFSPFKLFDVSGNQMDTVHTGTTYGLKVTVKNIGTAEYNGTIKFAVSTLPYKTNFDTKDVKKYYKFTLPTSIPLKVPANGGTVSITMPFPVNEKNFSHDTPNIVIIWPNETIAYQNTDNDFSMAKIYVAFDGFELGIQSANSNDMISGLFPNPAANTVRLAFKQPQKGSVILTDLIGRTLETYPLNGEENLDLDLQSQSGTIPPGMYLLKIMTANGQETHKLLIK